MIRCAHLHCNNDRSRNSDLDQARGVIDTAMISDQWLSECPTKREVQGWQEARWEEAHPELVRWYTPRSVLDDTVKSGSEYHDMVAQTKAHVIQTISTAKECEDDMLTLNLSMTPDTHLRRRIISQLCARYECNGRAWTGDSISSQKYISPAVLEDGGASIWKLENFQLDW